MEAADIVTQIVIELGPLVDRLQEVSSPGPGRWLLGFDEDAITCELDSSHTRLYLTMELGLLPESRREDVLQSLLAFNSLWAETGGVRTAIDRPGGNVLQICDVLIADVDVTRMAQIVESLLAKADNWRSVLSGAETTSSASQQDGEPPNVDAIRV